METNRYINRELSWIDFNSRVLFEADRDDLPLMERVKYLAIVCSNFDEFFMVRMANLLHEIELGNRISCPSTLRPDEIFSRCLEKIRVTTQRQNRCLMEKIYPELHSRDLVDFYPHRREDSQCRVIFQQEIMDLLTPLCIEKENFQINLIKGQELHLLLNLKRENRERYVIIPVPTNIPRFYQVEDQGPYLPVEAIISNHIELLFPGESIEDKALFRILRDADMTVDEQRDEDFLEAMEEVLENRKESRPLFLEYSPCSRKLLDILESLLELPVERCFLHEGLLQLRDFTQLWKAQREQVLFFPPQPPCRSPFFMDNSSPWKLLLERDVLLHHPYESFAPVVQLIQKAAQDPRVMAIKMTLYRTSGDSPIISALLDAAKAGKQVTVLVELKARFDEKRNIKGAKKLSRAGALVIFGIAGLKVHAKALLILRREEEGLRRYLHLGTGNYNDKTAEYYTDFSLMTSRDSLTGEAAIFFNTLTGHSDSPELRHLAMAPFSMKSRVISLIEREMALAAEGEEAHFMGKFNSLTDADMVEMMYRASQAGVRIDLNVRGICSLIPGIPGLSENIRVLSVVGRHLEHCRCYYFLNGGKEDVYLSSGDWMPRNLERRVELLFPVLDRDHKEQLKMVLDTTLSDNCQAHQLNNLGDWKRLDHRKNNRVNSQEFLYNFYSQRSQAAKKEMGEILKIRKTPESPME